MERWITTVAFGGDGMGEPVPGGDGYAGDTYWCRACHEAIELSPQVE